MADFCTLLVLLLRLRIKVTNDRMKNVFIDKKKR